MQAVDSSAPITLHARLRSQTRVGHKNAEQAMDLDVCLLTLRDYGELLGRLWRLHSAYEHALGRFDWSQVGVRFEPRRRAHWLIEDMIAIGVPVTGSSTLSYPIESIEAALGSLYVLEGSSLGGQVIQRRVLRIPGISATHGARFFSGHGSDTMVLWREFIGSLNRFDANSLAATVIEQSATRTFDEFASVLGER